MPNELEIERIFFHRNDEGEIEACLIFSDGETSFVDRATGEDLVLALAKREKCRTVDELMFSDYFQCFPNEEDFEKYVNIFSNYYSEKSENSRFRQSIHNTIDNHFNNENDNEEETEEENKDDNKKKKKFSLKNIFKRKNKNKMKIPKIVKKIIKWVVISFTGIFLVSSTAKHLNNKDVANKKIENNKDNTKGSKSKTKTNIGQYKNMNSAIEHSDINDNKKHAVNSVWKFLNNYNKDVAKQYSDKNNKTKLAHTWNEAMAYYLAFNNIKQSDANKIFDKYKFNADNMIKAYKEGMAQDVQAYSVLNSSLGKENLIINQNGQNFYTDYEKMMVKFNSITEHSDITKESVANQFYKRVKQDLLNDNDIKPYKLSVIPIVKTFNKLTKDMNFSEKLTDKEIEKINNLSSSVYSKFKKYERNLENNRMADKALNNNDDELSYRSLKNLGIKELRIKDNYNVSDKERDITNSKLYKESLASAKPTIVPQSENKENKDNNNDNNDNKKKEYSSSSIKSDDNQNSKTKDKIKTKKTEKKKSIKDDFIPVNYNWREVNYDDIEYPITDNQENNITLEDDITNQDNVKIDDSYIDDMGSLDSSITNITTDPTGAVDSSEELPDPNQEQSNEFYTYDEANANSNITEDTANQNYSNEVVATVDTIVEEMANSNQTDVVDRPYVKK